MYYLMRCCFFLRHCYFRVTFPYQHAASIKFPMQSRCMYMLNKGYHQGGGGLALSVQETTCFVAVGVWCMGAGGNGCSVALEKHISRGHS